MNTIAITCDRCKRNVEGLASENGTAGYYRRDEWWGKFMDEGEDNVCDECVWTDERYIAEYRPAGSR